MIHLLLMASLKPGRKAIKLSRLEHIVLDCTVVGFIIVQTLMFAYGTVLRLSAQ